MEKTTLTVDSSTARKAYPSAPPELKAILEQSFPKGFFTEDITERIKSFEDACEYNNTNPMASRFVSGTRHQMCQERVAEITRALNEGWLADYNDDSQYKHYPYFRLDGPSGFRFSDSGCGFSTAGTGAGARFVFKSEKLAAYAGKQFVKEYENWMSPEVLAHSVYQGFSSSAKQKSTGDMKAWESYIIPRIKTFEDACAEIGENPNDYRFSEGEPDEIAAKRMKVICRALNGVWVCNWADGNQRKWYPWMEYDAQTSGFRFYDSYYDFSAARTGTGARLRLCSEPIAKHFGTQFAELITQNLL